MNRLRSSSRRTLRTSTGVLALALLAVLAAPSVACATSTASKPGANKTDCYVALGDSYTAAPLVAKRNHARYVDVYKPTIGHDVCQPVGTRWVEGLKPTSPAAPIHPNALGESAMAKAVLAALGRH